MPRIVGTPKAWEKPAAFVAEQGKGQTMLSLEAAQRFRGIGADAQHPHLFRRQLLPLIRRLQAWAVHPGVLAFGKK